MEPLSFPYMRATLALLFALAGLVTLSNEAHCLGMSVTADVVYANPEAAHSHTQDEKQTSKEHVCHHENEARALSGWAFLHQTPDSLSKPIAVATPAHGDVSFHLTAQAKLPPAPSGTPPPLARIATQYADMFAATDRMLI